MRRFIMICAIAAAITSCKVKEGDDFEPTRLGYSLAYKTVGIIEDASEITLVLKHFNEYLAADAESREEIHDRYFYKVRIVERDNGDWQIIQTSYDALVIVTGGHLLDEAGASWQCYRTSLTYDSDEVPTVTRLADGEPERFAYHQAWNTDKYGYDKRTIDLEFAIVRYEKIENGEPVWYERADAEGSGEIGLNERVYGAELFTFAIKSPLQLYRKGYDKAVTGGSMSMRIDIDGTVCTPEATFNNDGSMTVRGGKDNAFEETYYDNRYWYYE